MAQHNFVNVGTQKPAEIETAMIIANPSEEFSAEVELVVKTTLPRGWRVRFRKIQPGQVVAFKKGEKRVVQCSVRVPDEPLIRPPINGYLVGSLSGLVPGDIEGWLEQAGYTSRTGSFQGQVTGTLRGERPGDFRGEIKGRILDEETGEFLATVELIVAGPETHRFFELSGRLRGRLIPRRSVSISQRVNGELAGGVDLNFQLQV